MVCSKCGLEPHPGARFCGHCGARLPQPPVETPASPPPAAAEPHETPHLAEPAAATPARTTAPKLSAVTGSATPPPIHSSAKWYVLGGALVALVAGLAYVAIREFRTPAPVPTASIAAVKTPVQPVKTPAPPPTGPGLNYIDTYLQKQQCSHCTCLYNDGDTSPLLGSGNDFVANGGTFNVDPRLIVAIAGQETSFGLHTCCTRNNNAWNWFWCYADNSCAGQPCQHSPFDSWASGIKTVSKYMRKSYISHGYNTVALIGHKYCIDNCSAWVGGVTRFYTDLGGDPDHLDPSS